MITQPATFKTLKNIIKAIQRVNAYSGYSRKTLILKVWNITRKEGIKGLINRTRIWLIFSGAQPLSTSTWHQTFSNTGNITEKDSSSLERPITVSVIVPNYNHADYLRRRLDSIYQQTYPHIYVILLDDASSDNSREILTEYAIRHPTITTCLFNESNSGGVFHQWLKGFKAASGDIIWVAESDDYCTPDFLEKLVIEFRNQAVRIAFCRTEFVDSNKGETIWCTEQYLNDLGLNIWDKRFIASANATTKHAWVVKNIIPNVSSCIFRHPHQLSLLQDDTWKSMRLCGDWVFYLAIARGGLVCYRPDTTNYYRQHSNNTSVSAQREEIYYQEHRIVQQYLSRYYQLDYQDTARLTDHVYKHWCIHNGLNRKALFEQIFHSVNTTDNSEYCLNIAIATYALVGGGGETFPLMLANLLHRRGHAVTIIDFNQQPPEEDIRKMLSSDIALLTLSDPSMLQSIVSDFAIQIIHSHHGWVDMTIAALLSKANSCRHVVTMHGMYEMMTPELFASLEKNLDRVDGFVYTATKNLAPFSEEFQKQKFFECINNTVLAAPYMPIDRRELGVSSDDFVLCMVARGIPEKGWREAIESVLLANASSKRPIQLLLIGDGEEPERLRSLYAMEERIHFLGFQGKIRSFLSSSDMGFIPTRFPGESFPLVLIDSLMCGKPVLASDIGEIGRMLETDQGKAGITFSLEEGQIPIHKLAELIAAIANDRERYQSLVKRVKAAAPKFDPDRMVSQYEHFYSRVCGVSYASE